MTKNELLNDLEDLTTIIGYTAHQRLDKLIDIVYELVERLPNEAPEIERTPNANLQD